MYVENLNTLKFHVSMMCYRFYNMRGISVAQEQIMVYFCSLLWGNLVLVFCIFVFSINHSFAGNLISENFVYDSKQTVFELSYWGEIELRILGN